MLKQKRIVIITTNGKSTIKLLWFALKPDGIYGSFVHPKISMKKSYHADGNVHWKLEAGKEFIRDWPKTFKNSGYSHKYENREYLASIKGSYSFLQAGFRLDADLFRSKTVKSFDFKKIDYVIYIDSRVMLGSQKFVNLYLDLIERGSFKELNDLIDKKYKLFSKSQYHFFPEFNPWVMVSIGFTK